MAIKLEALEALRIFTANLVSYSLLIVPVAILVRFLQRNIHFLQGNQSSRHHTNAHTQYTRSHSLRLGVGKTEVAGDLLPWQPGRHVVSPASDAMRDGREGVFALISRRDSKRLK